MGLDRRLENCHEHAYINQHLAHRTADRKPVLTCATPTSKICARKNSSQLSESRRARLLKASVIIKLSYREAEQSGPYCGRRLSSAANSVYPWNARSASSAVSSLSIFSEARLEIGHDPSHLGADSASRCLASCANGSCRPAANARSSVSRPFASCLVCSCAIPR